MRLSIRNNTFETNSSSVHSFVFENASDNEPIFLKWNDETFSACDTAEPDGQSKTVHLFSWLPALVEEVTQKAENKMKDEYGHVFRLVNNDPIETALHEWEYEERDDKIFDLAGKAEVLIMYFPSRKSVERRLLEDSEEGYHSWGGNAEFEGYPLDEHLLALSSGKYIYREKIMELMEKQALARGYVFDYGILDKTSLCHVTINETAEHRYDAISGIGDLSLLGAWSARENYYHYKRWFLDDDGIGIGEYLFNDKCGYMYTCEGESTLVNLQELLDDDFVFAPTYRRAPVMSHCNRDYLLGKRFSATYEHMG